MEGPVKLTKYSQPPAPSSSGAGNIPGSIRIPYQVFASRHLPPPTPSTSNNFRAVPVPPIYPGANPTPANFSSSHTLFSPGLPPRGSLQRGISMSAYSSLNDRLSYCTAGRFDGCRQNGVACQNNPPCNQRHCNDHPSPMFCQGRCQVPHCVASSDYFRCRTCFTIHCSVHCLA